MPPPLTLSVLLSPKEEDDEEDDIEQAEAEIAALQVRTRRLPISHDLNIRLVQASLKARMEALAKRKRIRVDDLEAAISTKRRRVLNEEQ